MTVGVSPSITATQLLVVPKSIPITVPIINSIQYIDIFILPYKIHLTIKKKIKIRIGVLLDDIYFNMLK